MTSTPLPIIRLQRYWRRSVQLIYWSFRCLWKQQTGRFFFLRDAPDWFVRLCAWLPACENPKGSDFDIEKLRLEALSERALRRRQRKTP